MTTSSIDHLPNEMKDCITACWDCRTLCQKTLFHHCLEMGGKHVEQRHVRLMIDCMEICQTAADFMVRGSDMHGAVCAACAEVCHACADSCDEVGGDEMMACAQLCRECGESCDDMSLTSGRSGNDDSIESSITLV